MYIVSYDLGTGGVKASLHNEQLKTLSKVFIEYDTQYPEPSMHEQRISDWWNAIIDSTRQLISDADISNTEISCVALSGASLVAIPMDKNDCPILDFVPIWSDTRATKQAEQFFEKISFDAWYRATGNGFPAPCYSIFKLMWLKQNCPEEYARTEYVLGSKDYINFRLTGVKATDYSYASGTGAYHLTEKRMMDDYLEAAGLKNTLFLQPTFSHAVIGEVSEEAAKITGLAKGTKVVCGGVDNACMAMGAVGNVDGAAYVSLGSSSWIPVNSKVPVLDDDNHPYVFAHLQEDMYTSAYSIFSGGSSFRWIRDNLCRDIPTEKAYQQMGSLAEQVPVGANGVFFNPVLAGGTSQDKSVNIKGGFEGLTLSSTREDMIRATMEGIAFSLKMSLENLERKVPVADRILFCGGGSKSSVWLQIFADIFGKKVFKSNVDQDAASLGAAAAAARGIGLIQNYDEIASLHVLEQEFEPDDERNSRYEALFDIHKCINEMASDLGDMMKGRLQ